MVYGLYVLCGSVGALVALTWLFRSEQRNGSRLFLGGLRSGFDSFVLGVQSFIASVFNKLGAGAVRATLHYVLHQLLGGIIALLTRLQRRLFRAYEQNKWQRTYRKDEADHEGHLHEIAKHKGETALTDAQKRKMRSH